MSALRNNFCTRGDRHASSIPGVTQLTDIVGDLLAARTEGLQRRLATPARTTRTAVVIGRLLAVGFTVCFLTGLYSHLLQNPLPGEHFPTWPNNLYQLSQGTHITVGIALIPLTLAKLWTIYPLLFDFPPIRSFLHALERASIGVLVSATLVQLATGLLNTYQWYPWTFPFRQVHFALAWVIVGSIALHIAMKLPLIVQHWRRDARLTDEDAPAVPAGDRLP